MPKKTILVVGGAGFIGSHVNKMLHQAGYETIVYDNLSKGNPKAVLQGLFIKGDIANSDLLDEIFEKYSIEAVMHFAAYIDVGESIRIPEKYYGNNVSNTLHLLKNMLRHNVKNFIFSSSAAVYGNPQEKLIAETHPTHPINPYGESKLMVEKMLHDIDQAYGLKYCSLRYFNAAGGDPEGELKNYKVKETNLIPLVLRSLQADNGSVTIFGNDYPTPDGTCIRDYIHVYDLGTAHIAAMEYLFQGRPSAIYNLGNGSGYSVKEVIRTVEKVTDKRVNAIQGDRRHGDPPFLVADSKKAQKELAWETRYPDLESMIAHAWKALQAG